MSTASESSVKQASGKVVEILVRLLTWNFHAAQFLKYMMLCMLKVVK